MMNQDHCTPAFSVLDYGAIGDGQTLNTQAIQAAIEACHQVGGGTVYFPSGNYLTGSLFLRSHVTLHLDAGATLLGSENLTDYPVIDSCWEGADQKTYAPLIAGSHLNNAQSQVRRCFSIRLAGDASPRYLLERRRHFHVAGCSRRLS